jgi:hypothetical protein
MRTWWRDLRISKRTAEKRKKQELLILKQLS